jgi:hypothetical protein
MHALTIGTSAIRQLDGLYSLNDLHAAAGGDKNQQPANFMRLDQTQALVAEINSSEMRSSTKTINGRKGGTYVCRELVYAYANWISPAFYLKMIRAFDALQQPALAAPAFDLRAVMLSDNSTPSVPLPGEIQTAINRKAWVMAHDAYELCREHLARRVAYTSECGNPRRLDSRRALEAISETTLDMALAPRHYNMLHMAVSIGESMVQLASGNLADMRKELKGMMQ